MEKLLQKPVSEFMTKDVVSVKKDEAIKHLFSLMDKHDILGVPVVDGGNQVVGIVTESDLIGHFTTLKIPRGVHVLGSLLYLDDIQEFNANLKDHCAETVEGLMTSPATTVSETATLLDALNTMSENKVNRLPITDKDDKLVGILTRSNIIHELAKLKQV